MELVGYDNLTKFQRRWVDNMIEIYPDLVSGGAITLEQCTEGIVKLKAKHAEDPTFPKIGIIKSTRSTKASISFLHQMQILRWRFVKQRI